MENHETQVGLNRLLRELLLKMKLTLMLILLFLAGASASTYSQNTRLNISLKDGNMVELIKQIEAKSEFLFYYQKEELTLLDNLTMEAQNATVMEILDRATKGTNFDYTVIDRYIVVRKTGAGFGNDFLPSAGRNMSAQQQSVFGTVTDATDHPLPGVTVVVKGTTKGTVTDTDGNYSLSNIPEDATLIFSFVGMISQEIQVNGQSQINVKMEADYIGIEEIVAVGYGTMKKSDLTGSVASVTPEKLIDRPVTNIGQALQNKISGVQVIKMAAGEPGSRPQIRIRGTNSINTNSDPLFVVDGIVGVKNALHNLNPNDIESIDVLKDASATAIYGTRGANGVIIIQTKRGAAGDIQVNYSGSVSYSIMTRHNYTVTADQFMYLYEQAFNNTPKYGTLDLSKDFRGGRGTGLSWSEMPHLFEEVGQGQYLPGLDFMGNDGKYYKPRFYSDWEDYAFNPAWSHDHYVDVSGGSEKARLSLSLGHIDQDGLMLESYYKRTNASTTADVQINDWLDLSANMAFSRSKKTRGDDQTRTVAETWPILPVKYPDDPDTYGIYAGLYSTGRDFAVGENWRNIVYVMDQRDGYYIDTQFRGGAILNAQITPDLSFKTDFSVDNRSEDSRWFNGDFQGTRKSDARGSNARWFYWQNQNYFNYNKTIGNHNIMGMLGLSWSEDMYDWVEARAYNFTSNFYLHNNLNAGADTPQAHSSSTKSALNSYFARFNYSYLGRYMLTVTGRYDGSSKFGENNKYAFFPSIGGAWRISEEGFMSDSEAISNLKLRASAGQTGNQEIGSYVTQQYINNATVMFGNGKYAGLYPGSTGNPNLKWETTTQYDLGLDLGLFQNRINLVLDFYYKKTTDMLFELPLPESTTSGTAWVNYGAVENKGFEIELTTRNIDRNDFSWTTTLTLTNNRNKVLELGPTNADVYVDTGAGNATSVYRVGEPIGSFFGLNRMGVWGTEEAVEAARYGRLPGDLKFEDVNQDGKIELITDGDIIGHAYPKGYGGLINSFSYKNFDANINIQFVYGVNKSIVHESAEDRQFVSGMVNRVLNAWRPDHQTGTMVAQVRAGNAGARYDSYTDTHQMYDGSFIRGQSASLGYTFVNKFGLKRMRVFYAMENFFLITGQKLEGYDPEGSSQDKQRANIPNIDKYQYPTPTNFSLGVNVSF
jgi:TonB-linked SusC/RagA family outer membrane protein